MKTILITYDPVTAFANCADPDETDLFGYLRNELDNADISCTIADGPYVAPTGEGVLRPRLTVTIDGGLLQTIEADTPGVEVCVIDFDIEGTQDEIRQAPDGNDALISVWFPGVDVENVAACFACAEPDNALTEDELTAYFQQRIEDGDLNAEDMAQRLARYGLMDPQQFKAEMAERMGGDL